MIFCLCYPCLFNRFQFYGLLPLSNAKQTKCFTGGMSWLLFGVYEIGYTIEDPFQGTLRLSILCDGIRRDVLGDDLHRYLAFQLNEHENPKVAHDKDLGVSIQDDFEENEVADEEDTIAASEISIKNDLNNRPLLDGAITDIDGQHAFE
jgi:hypothetical protein